MDTHLHRRAGGPESAVRARAEEHVVDLYRAAGYSPPGRFLWSGSPFALARSCTGRFFGNGRDLTPELVDAPLAVARREVAASGPMEAAPLFHPAGVISEAIGSMIAGLELRWPIRWLPRSGPPLRGWNPMHGGIGEVARLHAAAGSRGLDAVQRRIAPLVGLSGLAGWIVPTRRVCWLSDTPGPVRTDDAGRLHCASGAAVDYPDGWQLHAWKGVVVPGWVIECPWRLTASVVDHPHSALVRRCMIDIMTPARFIAEGGAHCLSSDSAGKLWWRRWWNRYEDVWDAWAAVEVVNGSEEVDGTRTRYFLQVPPEMRTARQAVAWTYGLSEQQYAGLLQRT